VMSRTEDSNVAPARNLSEITYTCLKEKGSYEERYHYRAEGKYFSGFSLLFLAS